MPYRTPIFRSKLDGRLYIRPYDDYQAPIFKSPAPGWNAFIGRANIVASWFVPRWMQRRLDCRKGAHAYWARVRKQEQRERAEENFDD